jgi:GH15 family glucan-1,4-alpha-glucosidase
VYGELVLGFYETIVQSDEMASTDWEFIRKLLNYVCDGWSEPDFGIWEVRSEPRHFVYSKVMCWAALDRGIDIVEKTDVAGPVQRWRARREDIREAVLDRGYDQDLGCFVRSFEADDALDATSLLIPVVGFLPATDSRVQGTIDAIIDRLTTDDGLVYRYDGPDGVPGDEGAFVLCSFWLVDALALSGRIEEATRIYRNVLAYAGPLGLFAEEIDPATGEQRGNFPQAFSHIGLVTSALSIARATESTTATPKPPGRTRPSDKLELDREPSDS